jgi:hypothetical protein
MNNLSVSEGHDLQAVAGASETSTPPADAGGGANPDGSAGSGESQGSGGEGASDAPAAPTKRRKSTAEPAAADAQS